MTKVHDYILWYQVGRIGFKLAKQQKFYSSKFVCKNLCHWQGSQENLNTKREIKNGNNPHEIEKTIRKISIKKTKYIKYNKCMTQSNTIKYLSIYFWHLITGLIDKVLYCGFSGVGWQKKLVDGQDCLCCTSDSVSHRPKQNKCSRGINDKPPIRTNPHQPFINHSILRHDKRIRLRMK